MEEVNLEKEKDKSKDVTLVRVPTGEALAFHTPDGKTLANEEYLVWLGNILYRNLLLTKQLLGGTVK